MNVNKNNTNNNSNFNKDNNYNSNNLDKFAETGNYYTLSHDTNKKN